MHRVADGPEAGRHSGNVPVDRRDPVEHSLDLNPASLPCAAGPVSAAIPLQLPSIDTPWRYSGVSGWAALRGLAGLHRLRAGSAGCYSAPVHISPRLAGRWRALFDVPARAAASVPLLHSQSVGALMYTRLFADLGINLRHLLHLQHRTVHDGGVDACARARVQQLTCAVQRVLRLGEDRVLVAVQTQARTPDGRLLYTVEDGFLVKELPSTDLTGLPSDRALLRELLGLRRRLPRLSATDGKGHVAAMVVHADMGLDYGRISGDMNPMHTSRLGAWLLGLKRPLLQGLGLRNLVVRHLVELGVPIGRLSLTFASPAHLGQQLLLLVQDEAFEVHDAKGRLVAFGQCAAAGLPNPAQPQPQLQPQPA